MSLTEIARFTDVHEAGLARAFLASHGVETFLTEYHQTTIDPLMQRALGIRLLAHPANAGTARELLAQVRRGDFAEADGDDIPDRDDATQALGVLMAAAAFLTGGFWGNSLPRRFRPIPWMPILLVAGAVTAVILFAGGLSMLREISSRY